MKSIQKVLGLLGIGLVTAVLIYPLLHEAGHVLTSVLLGGRVVALSWLPLPSVVSEVGRLSAAATALIGWGGLLLPALLSLLLRPRRFCLWYGVFVLRFICLLSFLLAAASAVCYTLGHPLPNDDITTLLSLCGGGERTAFCCSLAGALLLLYSLFKTHPLIRCHAYFYNISTKSAERI